MPDTDQPRTFLTAHWRDLVLANYAVDPELVQGLVPRGAEIDSGNGVTWISLVGFHFDDTRVLGAPVPFHRRFEEVNLRFYVRRQVHGETRRAVGFIKELVPRRAIAWVARTLYGDAFGNLFLAEGLRISVSEGHNASAECGRRFCNLPSTGDYACFDAYQLPNRAARRAGAAWDRIRRRLSDPPERVDTTIAAIGTSSRGR